MEYEIKELYSRFVGNYGFHLVFLYLAPMFKFRFDRYHFIAAFFLFIVLVLIALFVRDHFIRPIFGDFLVVIFMYYTIGTLVKMSKLWMAIGVLLFAYAVEIGQYYNLVYHLGLKGNRFAEIVIGLGFTWTDMLAYTLGAMVVYFWETRNNVKSSLSDHN